MSILEKLLSPASFKLGEFEIHGPAILTIPFFIAIIGFFIFSIIWIYKDSQKRNKNGFIAALFILLTGWPLSFLWWFWIRPSLKNENHGA